MMYSRTEQEIRTKKVKCIIRKKKGEELLLTLETKNWQKKQISFLIYKKSKKNSKILKCIVVRKVKKIDIRINKNQTKRISNVKYLEVRK